MIGKITALLGSGIAYFCISTVLAVSIILGVLAYQGKLGMPQVEKMLALLQGVELAPVTRGEDEKDREVPSFEEIVEARAIKLRQLEMREQALRREANDLFIQQKRIAEEMDSFKKLRNGFNSSLDEMTKGATAKGQDEVRSILENVEPQQAKAQILKMLEKDEMNAVVAMLAAMPAAKKADIIAEFTSEKEMEQLDEILRRIKQGQPKMDVISKARREDEKIGSENNTEEDGSEFPSNDSDQPKTSNAAKASQDGVK